MHALTMRIEAGMRIETNYGTGPYTVERVKRTCTSCYAPQDILESGELLRPHMHLYLRDDKGHGGYSLNYYDEETLRCIVRGMQDRVIILETKYPVQRSLSV